MLDETQNLAKAMTVFSRSPDIDAPIYQQFLLAHRCDTVVEFGAGAGRLIAVWLWMDKKAIAIEKNATLRLALARKYSQFLSNGQLQILETLEQLSAPLESAILIAPYNVAFHFPTPATFARTLQIAFNKGIRAAAFDTDALCPGDFDWENRPWIKQRDREGFIEETQEVATGQLAVCWRQKNPPRVLATFPIYLHYLQDLRQAIARHLPLYSVGELARIPDSLSAEIAFLQIYPMFNLHHLFPGSDRQLQNQFKNAIPYSHALFPNAIASEFADRLCQTLNALPFRWRRVRESFYEHEVCNLLEVAAIFGGAIDELVRGLQEPSLVARLCKIVGAAPARLVQLTGHRLYDGDYIHTHTDENLDGEKFRLLLFPDSHPQFSGGILLLQQKVEEKIVTRAQIPYVPFQAYLFRFGANSHHAVTSVRERIPGANRLTLLATYGEGRSR